MRRSVTLTFVEDLPRVLAYGVAGAFLTILFLALYKLSHAEWRAAIVFPLLGLL